MHHSVQAVIATRNHFHDMTCFDIHVVDLLFHQHNVKTVLGAENRADTAYCRVIHSLFQGIDIAERGDPTQLATRLLYVRVSAHFASYCVESLNRQTHQFGFFAFAFQHLFAFCHADTCLVDDRQRAIYLCGSSTHRTLDGDVRRTTVLGHMLPAHLDDAVQRGFVLQVLRRSLCTVTLQLFLERLGGVNSLCLGFRYFELEINEHVQILVHGLRIHSSGLVVLLIDVQKLLCTHRLAVDSHQDIRMACLLRF